MEAIKFAAVMVIGVVLVVIRVLQFKKHWGEWPFPAHKIGKVKVPTPKD